MSRGKFIVIEGTDGSGKGTQFELLTKRLEDLKIPFFVADFPRYDNDSSYFLQKYLHGEYGSAEEVGPIRASVFYALDRYDASKDIRDALEAGRHVIANRYVGSNMAHQGSKLDVSEQPKFYDWIQNFEYEVMGIPKPDLNIVLHVPAKIAQELTLKKAERKYLKGKRQDIHEADLGHLERTEQAYLSMCKKHPSKFTKIECMNKQNLMSVEEIAKLIWQKVEPLVR